MNSETNVSDSVAGRRAMTASATDWLENSEVPRSPWSAFPSQSVYRSTSGSLRPSSSRIRSTCSSVAVSPATVKAGSPGTNWSSTKTPSDTTISNGNVVSSRLTTSRSIGSVRRSAGAGKRGVSLPAPGPGGHDSADQP